MKTILEELYDGNIYPAELIVSKDPEYRPLNQEISNTMKIWRSKLSEGDYEQLEALMDLRCKSTSMEASATFMYGFRLGAVIMIEVLTGKEKLVHGGD
jgi:predicted metallo-beta-lactamase superfamily hydrolase